MVSPGRTRWELRLPKDDGRGVYYVGLGSAPRPSDVRNVSRVRLFAMRGVFNAISCAGILETKSSVFFKTVPEIRIVEAGGSAQLSLAQTMSFRKIRPLVIRWANHTNSLRNEPSKLNIPSALITSVCVAKNAIE